MNIDDLTLGQIKQIQSLVNPAPFDCTQKNRIDHNLLGKKVIVRTDSAGVWFGVLYEKQGNEVVLKDARRMWRWWAAKSISLSGCAIHGIKHDESKICEAVPIQWVKAIEIIPCSDEAILSLEGAPNAKAE